MAKIGKSSIHIKTSTRGAVVHNARENFSHSVVFHDEKNEIWNDTKTGYKLYRSELKKRAESYTKKTGQSLQKNVSTKLSAVVNLERHHTLDDLKPLIEEIEKRFDTKVFQVAIHRDEGKIFDRNSGTEFYSGKDFFVNPENNRFYFDKKYTKEIDMTHFEIIKNYHAHIEMLGLNSDGYAIRHNAMNRHALRKLQDATAEILGMQRTKNTTKKKRRDVSEFKQIGSAREGAKRATQKQLKEEMKKLRESLKKSHAAREDYATLEVINRELKEKIKSKEISAADLADRLAELADATNVRFDGGRGRKVTASDITPPVIPTIIAVASRSARAAREASERERKKKEEISAALDKEKKQKKKLEDALALERAARAAAEAEAARLKEKIVKLEKELQRVEARAAKAVSAMEKRQTSRHLESIKEKADEFKKRLEKPAAPAGETDPFREKMIENLLKKEIARRGHVARLDGGMLRKSNEELREKIEEIVDAQLERSFDEITRDARNIIAKRRAAEIEIEDEPERHHRMRR